MDALEELIEGDRKYEVFYDEYDQLDIDFEDENDKKAYHAKFESGELASYGLCVSELCLCCKEWRRKDSVWGIHEKWPEDVLKNRKEWFGL